MPKKFSTENTKAAAARVRKEEAKAAATAKKQKEVEDALWVEDDKNVLKKEQRKVEREKKRVEQLERKKEAQRLLDEEQASLKGRAARQAAATAAAAGGGGGGVGKVTRVQISETLKREQEERAAGTAAGSDGDGGAGKLVTLADQPLEENINRLVAADDAVEARSVDDAIAALSTKENVDHHPERRMKAAYAAFEEDHLPRLRQQNPGMRMSQLKQALKKDWMRSPENPMNQKHAAYNVKA